jgi:N,N-dimethylformamidase
MSIERNEGPASMSRPQIMGYTDRLSVRPGDSIGFKVSCHGAARYHGSIVRLLAPAAGKAAPPMRMEPVETGVTGTYPGRVQEIAIGSWGFVPAEDPLGTPHGLTLQAMIWPSLPGRGRQAIFGTWSEATRGGFGLELDETGALRLQAGDGAGGTLALSTGTPLIQRTWYRIAVCFDRASGEVTLSQEPVERHGFVAQERVAVRQRLDFAPRGGTPGVSFAAWPIADGLPGRAAPFRTTCHFNGKIDRPRLASRALGDAELDQISALDVPAALADAVVGAWDFALDMATEAIRDRGPRGLDGRFFNMPARAATGHNWDGSEMDWKQAPAQYGAAHFHDDDLHDCGWDTDFTLTVPADLPSGVYAALLEAESASFQVPFYVRPPSGERRSSVAYLAATATYAVYANLKARLTTDIWEVSQGKLLVMDDIDQLLFDHPLGLSCYDRHSDGSGVAYVSRLRPHTHTRTTGRLWNFTADLFIIDWLERVGLGYDLITDEDLHAEGATALEGYQVVVTGSHPEYYTTEMLDGLEAWLNAGGRLMYMGGNGFYWRVSHHPTAPGVYEVRRAEDGLRAWDAEPGEYYHSTTGEYGGLWRRQNRAPNRLAGVGFIAQGFDASSFYRRRPESRNPRAAFIFDGVESTLFGNYGIMGDGAAGMEIDCADPRLGTPAHALVLASSEEHSNVYELVNEEITISHNANGPLHNPAIRADMTFFETGSGGAVFSTGSIAYAGALCINGFDNDAARIATNVLRRFADPTPFARPDEAE